jgi:hypothetical protein
MLRLRTALLAATLIASGAGGIALAQMSSTFDLDQLPETRGKVTQYLLTPRGDVDGLLLADGTEVDVPPHLSTQLAFAVKPGDAVTVHGLKARALPLVAAGSVTNDATRVTVTWNGPGHPHEADGMEAQGRVKAPLYDLHGDANGVLLEDGTVVRLPPPEAKRLAETLAAGKTLVVRGEGYAGPLGRALEAHEIGADAEHLVAVRGPRPGWGEPWSHERMERMREMMGAGPGWRHGPDAPPPPPPSAQ